MSKKLDFLFLITALFLSLLGNVLQANEKPQAVMDRVRTLSIKILEKSLQSENAFIRSAAARAAGESEYSGLIPFLKKASKDSYHTTRLFALQGIKKISLDEARAMSIHMSRDPNMWVRGAAIEMLGELDDEVSENIIQSHLKSPDRTVRYAAAGALFKLGDENQLDVLLDGLKGGSSIDRYQAIGYLGKLNDEKVIPYLKDLLDGGEDEIIFYSLKAIGKKVEKGMLPRLIKLTKHHNSSLRYQSALILGELQGTSGLKALRSLCSDEDGMVRLSAAVALVRKGSSFCREVFFDTIKDADYGIRSTTARILGELEIQNREQLLSIALIDKNIRVRTSATRAVGMMGGAKAFPLLLRKLEDSQEVVRTYAAGNIIKLMK